MAFSSVAPIYDVVIILIFLPFKAASSKLSIKHLIPLHLTKDTSKSIESHERISLLSSLSILGSIVAPVKSELCDIGVTGLMAFSFVIALLLFILEYRAVSISPFSLILYFLISSSLDTSLNM